MIFGNPYRFAIWIEHVPHWSESYKNGLFYLIINGNLYPSDIRTSTLSSDLYEIIDSGCALISCPENDDIFILPTVDAFKCLFDSAYPESSDENEYPDQLLDYCITSPNISNFGGCFFAIADKRSLRILGGVIEHLVKDESKERNIWKKIDTPLIEDITIPKDEIKEIMDNVREYANSLLK